MSDIKITWTPELPPSEQGVDRAEWRVIPRESIVLIKYRRLSDHTDTIIQGHVKEAMTDRVVLDTGYQVFHNWIIDLWVLKIGREFSDQVVHRVAVNLWKLGSSGATLYDELARSGKERIEDIAYRALMEVKHGPNPPDGPCEYVTSEYGAIVRVATAIYMNTTDVARPAWHRLTGQEQQRFIQIARRAMEQA